MPIPVLAPEANELPAQETVEKAPAAEAKVLQFPLSFVQKPLVAESPRQILRDRFLAHVVDAILVHGFSMYVAKVLSFLMALRLVNQVQVAGVERNAEVFQHLVDFGAPRIWMLSFVVFSCLYVTLCTHGLGRTFGKALFRLKVVRGDGGRPDLRQSFMRYVGYGFTYASLGIIALMGFLSAEKRTMHDRVSATDVVRA